MSLSKLKLLLSMCWFEAQRFKAFPLEIVASIFARVAETSLFITFWLLVGKYSSSGNIDPRDVISYYMIITGLTPFFYLGFGIASQTIKLIKTGELNQILVKPVNPIFYPWAIRTGRNLISLIFGLIQVVIGIIIAGGISVDALPYLIPVLINTLILNGAFNIILGTCGFYLTDANGVKNAFLHLAVLCRGELIPLFLMPVSVATFLQFTPFPASQYHLAILLQGNRLPEWGFVLIGSLWAAVLLFAAVRFWKHGLKKYEAVGI